jgi:DNA-binding GntR family transcriptional regulator
MRAHARATASLLGARTPGRPGARPRREVGMSELKDDLVEPAAPAPKAAALVAAHIRKLIVVGELAEGDLLPPEAEMLEQLSVSRPTLRQAFRVLEAEHLITVQRGSRGGTTAVRPAR